MLQPMKWVVWTAGLALLVAGCAAPTEPVSDGHQVTGDVEGVDLRLALLEGPSQVGAGETAQWTFALQNIDSRAIELARGCAHEFAGPWIQDASGKRIQHEPGMGMCDGFGHEGLGPGEEWTTGIVWDGTVYDPDTGEPAGQAEPGTYHIIVKSPWDEAGDSYLELDVPIQVQGDPGSDRSSNPEPEPAPTGPSVTQEVGSTTLRIAMTDGPESFAVGEPTTWTFNLTNVGQQSIQLAKGCQHEWNGPWVEDADGDQVRHQPATGICDGFSHVMMQPNETWSTGLQWNGTVYDENGQAVGEADAGTYYLRVQAPWDEAGGYYLDLDVPIQAE